VVVVDETSMVSLTLMARLLDAVRPAARLVLVGDPGQLASVEAGAVLGDVVGPAARRLRMRPPARAALAAATGEAVDADAGDDGAAIGDQIVVLRTVHRFGGALAALAEAARAGDAAATLDALRGGGEAIRWIPQVLDAFADGPEAAPVRDLVGGAGAAMVAAARAGDEAGALAALASARLLCAHRRGPHGVAGWAARAERWLAAVVPGHAAAGPWYPGRPLLVTRNDPGLGLANGDTGVVVTGADGRPVAVFGTAAAPVRVAPFRLEAVETVHAMTVHKGQGSQFDAVALVLPPAGSPILTRELLVTAVTRARTRLVVAGDEDAVRAAVERPVARASGLGELLWGPAPDAGAGR
jgi:exodeoxyribonuclease V alpha subunit